MHLGCRSLLGHKRITIIGGGYEGFFDGSGAHPAKQIHHRTRLIVGSAGARSAERLLSNDSTRWFIVDVEIAGRKTERPMRIGYCLAIRRKDATGQTVWRSSNDQV